MSKTVRRITEVYEPFAAIIAYMTGADDGNDIGYYLEKRNIRNGKMGVGKPLSQKMFASIIKKIQATSDQLDLGMYGRVPSNLLFCDVRVDRDKLVWYHEPEERNVFFKEELNIPNGRMKVPGLVYVVERGVMRLYAFKGKRPTDKLYQAPFMNTGSNSVCLGNAKVKKPEDRTFDNIIAYWEKMYWNSEFSHILGGNPIKGNLAVLTKELIETGKPFPTDVLVPLKLKLSTLLR